MCSGGGRLTVLVTEARRCPEQFDATNWMRFVRSFVRVFRVFPHFGGFDPMEELKSRGNALFAGQIHGGTETVHQGWKKWRRFLTTSELARCCTAIGRDATWR